MGPESESKGTLYWNGVPIATGKLQEITIPEDAPEHDEPRMFDIGMELTFTVRTPKRWRCRSRKRFIKLVMSKGISRNNAVWLADWVRNAGYSYSWAWACLLWR